MYTGAIVTLVLGSIIVLAVPALVWSSDLAERLRRGRRVIKH